jgi:hypothetical protein
MVSSIFLFNVLADKPIWKYLLGEDGIDILIRYQRIFAYVIETKIYSDETYFKKGKGQLAEYLKSEKLGEGYYVVFSHQHSEQDECFTEEIIQSKRIYPYDFAQIRATKPK